MVIDTIFICFCEDCEKNDGISRPYFMSRGLMVIGTIIDPSSPIQNQHFIKPLFQEFVENSKKALNYLDHQPTAPHS